MAQCPQRVENGHHAASKTKRCMSTSASNQLGQKGPRRRLTAYSGSGGAGGVALREMFNHHFIAGQALAILWEQGDL
jgi:hypothetical protein